MKRKIVKITGTVAEFLETFYQNDDVVSYIVLNAAGYNVFTKDPNVSYMIKDSEGSGYVELVSDDVGDICKPFNYKPVSSNTTINNITQKTELTADMVLELIKNNPVDFINILNPHGNKDFYNFIDTDYYKSSLIKTYDISGFIYRVDDVPKNLLSGVIGSKHKTGVLRWDPNKKLSINSADYGHKIFLKVLFNDGLSVVKMLNYDNSNPDNIISESFDIDYNNLSETDKIKYNNATIELYNTGDAEINDIKLIKLKFNYSSVFEYGVSVPVSGLKFDVNYESKNIPEILNIKNEVVKTGETNLVNYKDGSFKVILHNVDGNDDTTQIYHILVTKSINNNTSYVANGLVSDVANDLYPKKVSFDVSNSELPILSDTTYNINQKSIGKYINVKLIKENESLSATGTQIVYKFENNGQSTVRIPVGENRIYANLNDQISLVGFSDNEEYNDVSHLVGPSGFYSSKRDLDHSVSTGNAIQVNTENNVPITFTLQDLVNISGKSTSEKATLIKDVISGINDLNTITLRLVRRKN